MQDDHVGFTGSRFGMSPQQTISVRDLLTKRLMLKSFGPIKWFHHGDCVGADEQAQAIARELGYKIYCHPPLDPSNRAWTEFDFCDPEYSYHGRNQRIVKATNILIATPQSKSRGGRGGTWWTIGCSQRMGKPRFVIFPDGQMERRMTNMSRDTSADWFEDHDLHLEREGKTPDVSSSSIQKGLLKPARRDWFNIRVSYQYPPIPTRTFDWCAYYEGEEESGNYGQGSTPYMAILDLINSQSPTLYWEKQRG